MKPGRAKSKKGALPHPCPTFYYDVSLGSAAHRNSRTRGANISLLSPHFSCPKLRICLRTPRQPAAGPVPSCPPSQATTDNGQTHSDQLIMLPITSSTMRSWREAETRGLRGGRETGRKVEEGPSQPVPTLPWALSGTPHPHPEGQEQMEEEEGWGAGLVPHRGARCTAGCSLCRARGGCGGRSPSLQEGQVLTDTPLSPAPGPRSREKPRPSEGTAMPTLI